MMEAERGAGRCSAVGFEEGGRGHVPRNLDSHKELGKVRKHVFLFGWCKSNFETGSCSVSQVECSGTIMVHCNLNLPFSSGPSASAS